MIDLREVGCTLLTVDFVDGIHASCAGCSAVLSICRSLGIKVMADYPRSVHGYAAHLRFVRTEALGSQARSLKQSKSPVNRA